VLSAAGLASVCAKLDPEATGTRKTPARSDAEKSNARVLILWPPGFLNSTYPANRFSTMAFRCRHLKTATSVPWRRERKVLRLEAKTTFTKAFSKESACKSRAVSRKYRIMDLAGDHLSFRNFFRLIGPDSREPSKLKGEQR